MEQTITTYTPPPRSFALMRVLTSRWAQIAMAILIIAILSMLLTPADPMSMLLMMFPLLFLYELGLKLCEWLPNPSPFDDDAETA